MDPMGLKCFTYGMVNHHDLHAIVDSMKVKVYRSLSNNANMDSFPQGSGWTYQHLPFGVPSLNPKGWWRKTPWNETIWHPKWKVQVTKYLEPPPIGILKKTIEVIQVVTQLDPRSLEVTVPTFRNAHFLHTIPLKGHKLAESQSPEGKYCWWFRNPKQPPMYPKTL